MTDLRIIRNDGGAPITVSSDTRELRITVPVSALVNLREVLSLLPRLETLSIYATDYGKIDFTQNLSFLTGAKQLRQLALASMPHLKDCAGLVACNKLERLSLSRHVTKVFDFDVLPSLKSLRALSAEMPPASILAKTAKVVQLAELQLLGGFKLESLEALVSLANLQQLRLWSGSLSSSRGLSAFGKLRVLNLGYSKLVDTVDLGSLEGLIKLELVGNKAISNLDFLQGGALEFLGMYGVPKLDSLRPLQRMTRLKEFRCEAKVIDGDLLPLVNHSTLEEVYVPGRYKSALKKLRVDSACIFKVGRETFKMTKQGPLVLETAREANERLLKKLKGIE